MSLPQNTQGTPLKRGITTPTTLDPVTMGKVLSHIEMERIDNIKIGKYIPYKDGIRIRMSFNILLAIAGLYHPTKHAIFRELGYNKEGTVIAIKHLLNNGLIREIGKPRLIIPFGAYKVDKAYTVTPLGTIAIKKLLA